MKSFNLSAKFYIIFSLLFSIPSAYIANVLNIWLGDANFLKQLTSSGIIEAPTTIAILLLLFWVTDKWLWRIKFVNKLLGIPDINGRYTGTLTSSFDDTKTYSVVIEARQSLTKTIINLYTSNSSSYSLIANIGKNNKDNWSLFYIYQNNAKTINQDGDMKDHTGVGFLEIFDNGKTLKGEYFNNSRDRGRFGIISVNLTSQKILGFFGDHKI